MVWIVEKGQVREFVLTGFVALVSVIVLHQPWWSLQNVIIGKGAFTIPEMTFLKMSVGFLTSLAVLVVCKLLVRKLSYGSVALAIVVQILWIEFEWNFSIRASDTGELMIRFAEELGTLLLGGLLIGYLSLRPKGLTESGERSN